MPCISTKIKAFQRCSGSVYATPSLTAADKVAWADPTDLRGSCLQQLRKRLILAEKLLLNLHILRQRGLHEHALIGCHLLGIWSTRSSRLALAGRR